MAWHHGSKLVVRVRILSFKDALNLDAPAGSMRPKLTAATAFARAGGFAGIGRLQHASKIMERQALLCLASLRKNRYFRAVSNSRVVRNTLP
jgi:hypothetical protein